MSTGKAGCEVCERQRRDEIRQAAHESRCASELMRSAAALKAAADAKHASLLRDYQVAARSPSERCEFQRGCSCWRGLPCGAAARRTSGK